MKALSMFCNVGIAEIFFKKLGIKTIIANELNPKRANFYQEIFKENDVEMIPGDIKDPVIFKKIVTKSVQKEIDIIIATPPCQGMSTAGKGKKNWRDERNVLIDYVIKAAKQIKPKYIFIENVPTFNKTIVNINGKDIHIEDHIKEELAGLYNISNEIFNAADLGVAQNRKRSVFLLSNLKKCDENHFLKVENVKKVKKQKTVRDAIGKLPSLEPILRETLNDNIKLNLKNSSTLHKPPIHAKRHVDIMRKTPTGKSAFQNSEEYQPKKQDGSLIKGFLSTYKRMEWDKPSPTVTMANGSISSQNNVHPGRQLKNGDYSDARVLTILEVMRIMSIPDNWPLPDGIEDNFIRSVIGEGVPPLMMFTILKQIKEMGE